MRISSLAMDRSEALAVLSRIRVDINDLSSALESTHEIPNIQQQEQMFVELAQKSSLEDALRCWQECPTESGRFRIGWSIVARLFKEEAQIREQSQTLSVSDNSTLKKLLKTFAYEARSFDTLLGFLISSQLTPQECMSLLSVLPAIQVPNQLSEQLRESLLSKEEWSRTHKWFFKLRRSLRRRISIMTMLLWGHLIERPFIKLLRIMHKR